MDRPLFPGYVFCRFDARVRVPVLQSSGVVNLVSFGSDVIPIPDEEIQTVRRMLDSSLPVEPHPFLTSGQRIRITGGPLSGSEGILVEFKKQFRVVASITLLQRSVSAEVNREWVTPIS
jgi:transcription antitermination factor NusG